MRGATVRRLTEIVSVGTAPPSAHALTPGCATAAGWPLVTCAPCISAICEADHPLVRLAW